MNDISDGTQHSTMLLGDFHSNTKRAIPSAVCKAEAAIVAAKAAATEKAAAS